jgi:ABC-type branched-subunit amino acid transport system ATPase component
MLVTVFALSVFLGGVVVIDPVLFMFCTQGAWFNVEKDKIFCLLGPNGAGKTTTINCLTGIIPTTDGDGEFISQCV